MKVDAGYPRPLSVWLQNSGMIINKFTAAFPLIYSGGEVTYFFTGDHYYRFNDNDFKVKIFII